LVRPSDSVGKQIIDERRVTLDREGEAVENRI
jgi:hypothetical protein